MIMSIKRVKDEKAVIMKSDCNIALLVGKGAFFVSTLSVEVVHRTLLVLGDRPY